METQKMDNYERQSYKQIWESYNSKKKKKNRPNNYSLQEKVCKEKQRAREPILTPVEINLFEVFHVNLLSE